MEVTSGPCWPRGRKRSAANSNSWPWQKTAAKSQTRRPNPNRSTLAWNWPLARRKKLGSLRVVLGSQSGDEPTVNRHLDSELIGGSYAQGFCFKLVWVAVRIR